MGEHPSRQRVPYRLPELLEASEVYIVEGEKDADRLAKMGIVATCNPGGAGNWLGSFSRWFEGRHLVILPDNDQAGHKHAADVAAKLLQVAASIKLVELPGLPEKGDVSDWTAVGGTVAELQSIAAAAPYWESKEAAPCAFTMLRDLKPNLTRREIIRGAMPSAGSASPMPSPAPARPRS